MKMIIGRLPTIIWLSFFGLVPSVLSEAQHSNDLLEFLENRQLDRLAIVHLENQLSRETDQENRKRIARHLVKKYQKFFLSKIGPIEYKRSTRKAKLLLAEFPELSKPKIRLAISHANFIAAEQHFLEWWSAGAPTEQRNELIDTIAEVSKNLSRQIDSNEQHRDRLVASWPIGSVEISQQQQQLDQAESLLMHAHYLSAWVKYYLAVSAFEIDSQELLEAQQFYYRALQIEQTDSIENIDAKWIDYKQPLSRQALIGLALVYQARDNTGGAKFCFEQAKKLRPDRINAVAQFNSLAFSRKWKDALGFCLKFRIDQLDTSEQTSLWVAVANAGVVANKIAGSNSAKQTAIQLQRMGLRGMLRRFDAAAVQEFIDRHSIELLGDTVEDLWIQGSLKYVAAKDDSKLTLESEDLLTKAIELAGNDFDPIDLLHIKYLIGLIKLKRSEFAAVEEQIGQFQDLSIDKEFEHRICWLNCRAQIQLARRNKRRTGLALTSIEDFLSKFPDSSLAPRAQFEQIRITNLLLQPKEAIENLQQFRLNHKHFESAQLELVRQQHRLWQSQSNADRNDEESENASFEKLLQINSDISRSKFSAETKLKSTFLTLDASLSRIYQAEKIFALLDRADQNFAAIPNPNKNDQDQLKYYHFVANRQNKRMNEVLQSAQWLANNSTNSKFRIPALVFLANHYDQNSTPTTELIPIFERLSNLLGTTADDFAQSKNGRVAANRLVELYVKNLEWQKAAAINEALLKTNPNHLNYTINSARIATGMGKNKKALTMWRRVASNSKAGSNDWLESKFEVIVCLQMENPEMAAQVFTQTVNLAGKMEEPWKSKYTELSKSFRDGRK